MTAKTSPAPTTEQLLILVDRADRGLTPEEQAVLRAGIQRLDATRRSAGGTQAALRATRAQLASLQNESKEQAA